MDDFNGSHKNVSGHNQCLDCGIPSCYTDNGLWSYNCNSFDWKNKLDKDHPFIKYFETQEFKVEFARN